MLSVVVEVELAWLVLLGLVVDDSADAEVEDDESSVADADAASSVPVGSAAAVAIERGLSALFTSW